MLKHDDAQASQSLTGQPRRAGLPPLREQLAGVVEQLREGAGLADDRHEILVAQPSGWPEAPQ